jgi:hypothetical protein
MTTEYWIKILLIIFGMCIYIPVMIAMIKISVTSIISWNYNKKLEYQTKLIVSRMDIVQGYNMIVEYINTIIQDSVHDVLLMNPSFNDKEYITEDAEAELRKEVLAKFSSRITNSTMSVISIYFSNPHDVIAHYIYLAVTNLVVENNTSEVE